LSSGNLQQKSETAIQNDRWDDG